MLIYDLFDSDGFKVGFYSTDEPLNLRKKYSFYYNESKVYTGRFKKAEIAHGNKILIRKSEALFSVVDIEPDPREEI